MTCRTHKEVEGVMRTVISVLASVVSGGKFGLSVCLKPGWKIDVIVVGD
jgi:hypothetical protein